MSEHDEAPAPRETLAEFLQATTRGDTEIVLEPENEEWAPMIERIHTTDRIHQVSEKTYFYFLEVLPPKWMRRSYFAFAEGQEELTLFWTVGTQHYCRRLTEEETQRFVRASGLSPHYGSM